MITFIYTHGPSTSWSFGQDVPFFRADIMKIEAIGQEADMIAGCFASWVSQFRKGRYLEDVATDWDTQGESHAG